MRYSWCLMSLNDEDFLPRHTWRVLGLAAVGLLALVVLGIALISAGFFDPRPAGALQAAVAPGARAVGAREERIEWLDEQAPGAAFTVRLSAAYLSGERDVGYGMALGEAARNFVVAVSPLGYVAVWENDGDGQTLHMPWQTWPHVQTGDAANEIQVDVHDATISVRINRELLWQGTRKADGAEIGIYAQSFGGPTMITYDELALFYDR